MSDLCCKKCQSKQYVKSGHVRGFQRYKCKNCGCQFTPTPLRGKNPALKSLAIVLYAYCGVSMGNIARILQVSTVAVLKWIRTAAARAPLEPSKAAEIVMTQGFWTFVNGKKPLVGCGGPSMGYRLKVSDTVWVSVVIETSESLSGV